jgi:aquaporin Z
LTVDTRKLGAEALGTFWLVLGGCGAAVLASAYMPTTNLGIGLVGVSLAFGFTVLTGAFALGHVSGGHFNPAITLGLVAGRRFPASEAVPYVLVQVVGGIAAAAVLAVIADGVPAFHLSDGFAANGFDDLSPGGYSLVACFVCEVVMTAMFLIVIMGATRVGAPGGTAPVAIGIALTLIHLISIPVTNTSVNPARSTSQALFAGGDYIEQLWLFWIAPILGGVLGALVYRVVLGVPEEDIDAPVTGDPDQAVA